MGGPTSRPPATYYCGICEAQFTSKDDYNFHVVNHDEQRNKVTCIVRNWPCDDTHTLRQHQLQSRHNSDFLCDCGQSFVKSQDFNKHRKFPSPCSDAFRKTSPTAMNMSSLQLQPPQARKAGTLAGCVDLDAPPRSENQGNLRYESSTTPTDASQIQDHDHGHTFCQGCRRSFDCPARYSHHKLGCVAKQSLAEAAKPGQPSSVFSAMHGRMPVGARNPPPAAGSRRAPFPPAPSPTGRGPASPLTNVPHQSIALSNRRAPAASATTFPPQPAAPASNSSAARTFLCNVGGCPKTFRSEAGLKVHKQDAHNVGGRGLDFTGKDSWMLSQRERTRLREEGLLNKSGPSPSPRGGYGASTAPPAGPSVSGPEELAQAYRINDQMLRMLMQADIIIQHDGKLLINGIAWTRIGVSRQPDVVGMLEKYVALPAKLQRTEFLPSPKAFSAENTIQYPSADFQPSPDRNTAYPVQALDTVAITCSKIVLADGRQEVVKIAAVDVLSCRILLHHLVCTDATVSVKDWKTKATGLKTYGEMEAARREGYKVFKGWKAARTALQKFINKETILVGCNLRSDLDALRMVHGRAVDVAKLVEKAAKGSLSRMQLSLESICRDFPAVRLLPHPAFGQDVLQLAFGAREMALWTLKNEEKLVKGAMAKSQEYQLVAG